MKLKAKVIQKCLKAFVARFRCGYLKLSIQNYMKVILSLYRGWKIMKKIKKLKSVVRI